jgi:calcineurin-like phosphoesterase family protein
MSRTFFTSDNHFSHKNIAKFCPDTRPDTDPAIMDQKMIQMWQAQVQPDDTVWMLGDVFFCQADRAKSIMDQLPGQKHLVYGNHDKVIRGDKVLQAKFCSVQEYKEIKIDGQTVVLFHYPIQEWNKIHYGAYHFHGHIHQRLSGIEGRILNVCVDSPTFGTGTYELYDWAKVQREAERHPVRTHHGKSGDM